MKRLFSFFFFPKKKYIYRFLARLVVYVLGSLREGQRGITEGIERERESHEDLTKTEA